MDPGQLPSNIQGAVENSRWQQEALAVILIQPLVQLEAKMEAICETNNESKEAWPAPGYRKKVSLQGW